MTSDQSREIRSSEQSPAPRPESPADSELDRTRENLERKATWKLLVETARPKQWIKNLLVFAAPGAAGVLTNARPLTDTATTFLAFCLAATATYMINDVTDREADARNPRKKRRPVARNDLSPRTAIVTAGCLLPASLVLAWIVNGNVLLVMLLYIVISVSYSLILKKIPILDISAVASGFLLRAVIGGLAADVPLSDSFLIVTSFGSLLVVAGKRQTGQANKLDAAFGGRRPIDQYPEAFLRHLRSMATAVTLTAYALWAFESAAARSSSLWFKLSIIPFVMSVMRYSLLIDLGRDDPPEDLLLSDRMLQVLGFSWIALVGIGVYGR